MTISAVSLAEGNLGKGINLHAFENWSTITRMLVWESIDGSPLRNATRADGEWGGAVAMLEGIDGAPSP